MFKVISMILSPKIKEPEASEKTRQTPSQNPETEKEVVIDRMVRMRARITSQNLKALKVPESCEDEKENRKDIISKGRDMDPARPSEAFTSRGKKERARRMGSVARDWQERVSHLPGFDVDPYA